MLLTYNFSATKGRQWGNEIYTFMCPLNIFDKLTDRQNEDKERFERSHQINEEKVYHYVQSIKEGRASVVGESVILSINDAITFKPIDQRYNEIGIVSFAMNANKALIAGHELKAAIRFLLEEGHAMQQQCVIPVVVFTDPKFGMAHQHYDSVLPLQQAAFVEEVGRVALMVNDLLLTNQWLSTYIDAKNQTLAKYSKRYFLKKQLVRATEILLEDVERQNEKQLVEQYWMDYFTRIDHLRDRTGYALRSESVLPYGTVLEAMAKVANTRLKQNRFDGRIFFEAINGIDWSRQNAQWQTVLIHESGRILKNREALKVVRRVIESRLG